jgi:hypothetical protein
MAWGSGGGEPARSQAVLRTFAATGSRQRRLVRIWHQLSGLGQGHLRQRLTRRLDTLRVAVIGENTKRFHSRRLLPYRWHHGRARENFTMQKLTDREIRQALLSSLERRANAPRATLEEVHVCNSNAIADVVAVYKAMHCYEIKGETDSINRVVRQAKYYDQAFPLISLVTTANHLRRAEEIVPQHWGIITANAGRKGSVIFSHMRGAGRNKTYSPEIALLSLWRSELLEFVGPSNGSLEKMNRQKIAALIASTAPVNFINENVGRTLASRDSRAVSWGSSVPCT